MPPFLVLPGPVCLSVPLLVKTPQVPTVSMTGVCPSLDNFKPYLLYDRRQSVFRPGGGAAPVR
jgi:hypothetical protein